MKWRQIHLGCPLNLFPGAEWLPGDIQPITGAPRSRTSGRLAHSTIRRFMAERMRRREQRQAIRETSRS